MVAYAASRFIEVIPEIEMPGTFCGWLGIQSGLTAARSGHDVIMSPYSHMYFDGYQADPKIEPTVIGYWGPLGSVYAFEPVHAALNEQESRYILGAQANL